MNPGYYNNVGIQKCPAHLVFPQETALGNGFRAFLYFLALAYCFIGLSAITARFFRSMENILKQTRQVVKVDHKTGAETIQHEKVWNFTIADISLLAFGTSFPQISLATIDAIRNLGNTYAGGLGPGTLIGSAAFDLFPIHAVCVVVPKSGELKKIADLGVWLVELFWSFWAYIWLYIMLEVWTPGVITLWESLLTVLQFGLLLMHAYAQDMRWPYLSLPLPRSVRPEDWVPAEDISHGVVDEIHGESTRNLQDEETGITQLTDVFSIHSGNSTDPLLKSDFIVENPHLVAIWKQLFVDAFVLESGESKKSNRYLRLARIFWQSLLVPWRFLFAFVPPHQIAHGWISFIGSLVFISGIAYVVTKLTDLISCVTGINPRVIAFTALAAGTSWPDLVASKIAAERQITADSAIANIISSKTLVDACIRLRSLCTWAEFSIPKLMFVEDCIGAIQRKCVD